MCLAVLSLAAGSLGGLTAQGGGPRQHFVFHVYVDPLFGDNALAMLNNPGGGGTTVGVLGEHPAIDGGGNRLITGRLQHAPYSFKTLRSAAMDGALDYVDAVLPDLPPLPQFGIPVDHVVVHCLPGLYGPTTPTVIDPVSGLPFNGESFPVVISRDRISLQGTSFLDTIFDARGYPGHIIERSTSADPLDQPEDFIDGITFRNAAYEEGVTGSGAAIWVKGTNLPGFDSKTVHTSISNCAFQGNTVGIAIDANAQVVGENRTWSEHEIYVINNTFAWNSIGLWQGNTGDAIPITWNHHSAVANNLFDMASPAGFPAALSSFEGVSSFEREVKRRGSVSLLDTNQRGLDFNAFDDTRVGGLPVAFNNGAVIGSFLMAAPTGALISQSEIAARVDLAGLSVQPRTLFVADALRLSPNGVLSEHDLRLCPDVSDPGGSTGIPVAGSGNPCVNMGIDPSPTPGAPPSLDIEFQNGATLCAGRVGLASFGAGNPSNCPADDAEDAPISSWDYDGEGFGNPRIAAFNLPPDAQGFLGAVDIGADERDELIVAGFVDGTRVFTAAAIPNAPLSTQDHSRVFFFGNAGTVLPRPKFNSIAGGMDGINCLLPWYEHVQAPTDVSTGNYTDFLFWTFATSSVPLRRAQRVSVADARNEIPRNLTCDFSPHLTSDFHPYWGLVLMPQVDPGFPLVGDPYACNTWFDSNPAPGGTPLLEDTVVDNQMLFRNIDSVPAHTTFLAVPSMTVTSTLPSRSNVLDGHLNPPLTFTRPGVMISWLLGPSGVFGPYSPCGDANLSFGTWCFNDAAAFCPEVFPSFALGSGVRFNFEFDPGATPVGRNLQTVLTINPAVLPPAIPQRSRAAEQDVLEAKSRVDRSARSSR